MTHREKLYSHSGTDQGDDAGASDLADSSPKADAAAGAAADGAGSRHNKSVIYVKRKKNSGESCGLDPNHTHFFLVDDGQERWGGEIHLRTQVCHTANGARAALAHPSTLPPPPLRPSHCTMPEP